MDSYLKIAEKYPPLDEKAEYDIFKSIDDLMQEKYNIIFSKKSCIRFFNSYINLIQDKKKKFKDLFSYDDYLRKNSDIEVKNTVKRELLSRLSNCIKHAKNNKINLAIKNFNIIKLNDNVYSELNQYLNDIRANKIIEEINNIDSQIQAKKDKFIKHNFRLLISQVVNYSGKGSNINDLIQEGSIGLVHAVNKYNYKLDFKFSTYAVWYIKQRIINYIGQSIHDFKVPNHIIINNNKIINSAKQIIKDTGSLPEVEDIADNLNIEKKDVKYCATAAKRHISLESKIKMSNEESDRTLTDYVVQDRDSERIVDHKNINTLLNGVLKYLSPREEKILRLRFGIVENNER